MDEAALRAMMPLSFGKKAPKKGLSKPAPAPPPSSSIDNASASSSSLGKRPAANLPANEDVDDGLTAEERAANLAAEQEAQQRREQGLDSEDNSSDSDDDDIGPPPPPPASLPPVTLPPMSESALFSGIHNKTISALAVDPSGARFALGSYDYTLSLYDFGGMTSSFSPFRAFEPAGSYPVVDLCFSSSSSHLLVISSTAQAKIFSRDGAELGECRKGDPYLRDMRNTNGHVSALTCGMFLPNDPTRFATGGSDSTVRIWDTESLGRGQEDTIVVKSKTRGGRTKVSAVQASSSHKLYAAGEDGSLSYWDLRANLNAKPRGCVEKAHAPETITSSIAVSEHKDSLVATRGGDGMVRLWDLRSFRSPVAERGGLGTTSAHTSVIFDPMDGKSVLTTTTSAGGEESSLEVMSTTDLSTIKTFSLPNTPSPVKLHWASTTDQLFITGRNGSLSVFYSPTRSTKGVTMAVSRLARSSSLFTSTSSTTADSYPIYSGNTSDLTASNAPSESAKRRKLAKQRRDPSATLLPQPPLNGPGKGGRIGAAATQHVVQSIYAATEREDPREALLRYASKDEGGDKEQIQVEFTKAWKTNQPKRIYSQYTEDDDAK